jgi:hypothetical protein
MFAAMNLAGYSAPEADDLRKAIAKKLKEKLKEKPGQNWPAEWGAKPVLPEQYRP